MSIRSPEPTVSSAASRTQHIYSVGQKEVDVLVRYSVSKFLTDLCSWQNRPEHNTSDDGEGDLVSNPFFWRTE